MFFGQDTIPCPDKKGQDIAKDLQIANLVRLARARGLQAYDLLKDLKKAVPYLRNRYNLELGQATSFEQAWLANIAWLILRQHIDELQLIYAEQLIPFGIAGEDSALAEPDALRLHITAIAGAIVGKVPDARQDTDLFYVAAMQLGQATCNYLAERYELQTKPRPGMGAEMSVRTSATQADSNMTRWMTNMVSVMAQYNVARTGQFTGRRKPRERRRR